MRFVGSAGADGAGAGGAGGAGPIRQHRWCTAIEY